MTIKDKEIIHDSQNENVNNNNNNRGILQPIMNNNNNNNNGENMHSISSPTHNWINDNQEENKSNQIYDMLYEIGEYVDCRDTVNHWLNAEIIAIKNNLVKVHYTGWSKSFDEWIDYKSDRIIKQWQKGMKFKINNRIDVLDEKDDWREARIIDIRNDYIKVHYYGYASKYDTWIQIDSNLIDEIGSHSEGYGRAKFSKENRKNVQRSKNKSYMLDEELFQKKLNEKGLFIKQIGADGNCLFRAFSDQLYGHEEYYQRIREICMDYIFYERKFFKNFVVGGEEKFDYYVERKRQDGVWADDIEIQALSEIYNRPIEIYAYSNEPMRTFHESCKIIGEPFRISYHGRSHYNSIKKIGRENEGLLQTPFGVVEDIALRNAKLRCERLREQQNNIIMIDESEQRLNQIINQSRMDFENTGKRDMEAALEESLALYEKEMANKGDIFEDEINKVLKNSIDNKCEEDMLKIVMEESKREQESDDLLQKIINESKKETFVDDTFMNPTIKEVVALGFPLEQVIEAYSLVGDDPNAIVNILTENYGMF